MKKLTTQKLHKVIQSGLGQLSSKYSPSQHIDRQTYEVFTMFAGAYVVTSTNHLEEIGEGLAKSGLKFTLDSIKQVLIIPTKQSL